MPISTSNRKGPPLCPAQFGSSRPLLSLSDHRSQTLLSRPQPLLLTLTMPRNPKRKLLPPEPRNPPPEPYPEHPLPTPDQCRVVRDSLLAFHGFPDEFAKYRRNPNGSPPPVEETVLDGLVITLLSQNTTDSNSRRAFDSLKSTFLSWNQVGRPIKP